MVLPSRSWTIRGPIQGEPLGCSGLWAISIKKSNKSWTSCTACPIPAFLVERAWCLAPLTTTSIAEIDDGTTAWSAGGTSPWINLLEELDRTCAQ